MELKKLQPIQGKILGPAPFLPVKPTAEVGVPPQDMEPEPQPAGPESALDSVLAMGFAPAEAAAEKARAEAEAYFLAAEKAAAAEAALAKAERQAAARRDLGLLSVYAVRDFFRASSESVLAHFERMDARRT